ncbi:MAG TPA: hypothetical protein VLH60_05690 [Sedimentisphaerales bacterium]|nr:hypothetical protein [Sedimentisphaerales bacterium]
MKTGKLLVIVAVLSMSVSAFAADAGLFGGAGYTFWTDYMWRGINMTQLIGNNKGGGANQMVYKAGVDVADLGKVGVSLEQVYFCRWDDTGASLAFTNMNVFIKGQIDGVEGEWTVGYGSHVWRNLLQRDGRNARSEEFYGTYSFSDACLWQGLTGQQTGNILNPSVTYLVDTNKADGGGLLILNLSHPMDMAQVDPAMTGITIAPTFTMAIDHRYYGSYLSNVFGAEDIRDTTKIGYMDYGVRAMADLTDMVGLTAGRLGLTAGIGYLDGVVLSDAKWYGTAGLAYNF